MQHAFAYLEHALLALPDRRRECSGSGMRRRSRRSVDDDDDDAGYMHVLLEFYPYTANCANAAGGKKLTVR